MEEYSYSRTVALDDVKFLGDTSEISKYRESGTSIDAFNLIVLISAVQ